MDPSAVNPFAVLTFIVAPAVLTNASSVMALGTSNRFARAIDRPRQLAAKLEGKETGADVESRLRVEQLRITERRSLLLVRALTAYYLSVGMFAAASLASLFGAIFVVAQLPWAREIALAVGLIAGIIGVAGLVTGSAILGWETRMTLRVLMKETEVLREGMAGRKIDQSSSPPP
jgi:hypothetical protein